MQELHAVSDAARGELRDSATEAGGCGDTGLGDTQGYDISFLVTFSTLEEYDRERVIAFIMDFMGGIDAEISAMKIGVNARARGVASQFMRRFV